MCGITGYWARAGKPEAWLRDLDQSVDTLRLRGPDDRGTWVRQGSDVAFGHTRLSILDLSVTGHQPMQSPDGDVVMAFNGEIYNFADLRTQLEQAGYRFRSSGDSEVALAALQYWGIAAVERFIGMFAIALWRESERRLWLIRDRLGVKPLYYAWNGREFWFGSELKAFRAFRAWSPELDRDALAEYLQFGYISAPRSIYRQVFKVEPGHWLELRASGDPITRCYWSALDPREHSAAPESALEEELEAIFIDAFRYRMVSDVPVGVFLSGGLDSTLVAAILARRAQCDVHAFTIGFPDPAFDESEPARRIAGHLGIRHTERILSPTEMLDILPRWGELFDEPFGDSSGVPTYLVSSVARESVKVALSADGGDELFSGYHQYGVTLERERVLKRIPRPARVALSQALKLAPFPMLQRVMEGLPAPPSVHHAARRAVFDRLERLAPIMPDVEPAMLYDMGTSSWTRRESERLLGCTAQPRAVLNGHARDLATYMTCCDLRHYLPGDILTKVDRATMAVSLEGREPLLDHRIVEFALRLPLDLKRGALGTKHLLRRILYRYVPRALVERPKRGFSVPLSRWLSGELSTLVDAYLAPARITAGAVFDPAEVERAVRGLRDGGARRDRLDVRKVWLLLAFEMWRERWT